LWAQSGGIFEASHFARLCEVNRKTIANYLNILADTHVVRVIRPFSSHKATEIVSSPKVYGFDTGFVCYYRGWRDLRSDDMGLLWEHFVLNEISARLQSDHMRYWRDKRHREIDFVWAPPGNIPTAIECKWFAANAETANLEAFKGLYPKSRLVVAARDVAKPYRQNSHGIEIEYMGLENLVRSLEGKLA
jgi:predicted AAA+ superfamily ATPase